MTSASVLFYGRRTRSARSSSSDGDDLPVHSHPTSSTHRRRDRNRHFDQHRQSGHRHGVDDHGRSSLGPPPSTRAPASEYESVRRGPSIRSSSLGKVINRENISGINNGYSGNNRLPGAVLLARQRLLQRLRGVSVSGPRQPPTSANGTNLWISGFGDWETNVLTELLPIRHQQTGSQKPTPKPPGLGSETLASLHHETFNKPQFGDSEPGSNASWECSICLESFIEGNELITLPCQHRFHSSCLYPWVQACGECPNCRTDITRTGRVEREV